MTRPRVKQVLLLSAGLLLAIACNDATSPPVSSGPPEVASITVAPSPDTLLTGRALQLTATAKDAAGNVLTSGP